MRSNDHHQEYISEEKWGTRLTVSSKNRKYKGRE
jgi:hypothetical protein